MCSLRAEWLGWIVLSPLVGCDGRGEEDASPHCQDDSQEISTDTVTSLGFAPQAIVDLASKPYEGLLSWSDGRSAVLNIAYERDGRAWFVDSDVVAGSGDTEPAIQPVCDDRVEVGASVTFATSDGAFAETWTRLRLAAVNPNEARWGVTLDLGALAGSFELDPFVATEDYDELRAWVDAAIAGVGESAGRVSGQASGSDDCDPGETCTSWAENVDAASWGKPDTE